jgi:hypothetical protein
MTGAYFGWISAFMLRLHKNVRKDDHCTVSPVGGASPVQVLLE